MWAGEASENTVSSPVRSLNEPISGYELSDGASV